MTGLVDIVIVNWNSGALLGKALASVNRHHEGLVASVAVIDNASDDDSMDAAVVGALPVPLVVERNASNRGFGAACNQGSRTGRSPYLLFLNPDARLAPGALELLVAFMQSQPGYAAAGAQLIDDEGGVSRSCARFPTPLGLILQSLGLTRLKVFSGRAMHMHEWAHDTSADVDHVIGAFYLVRRTVFEALGGFDERFFVYLEDLDLSRRIHQQNARIRFCADARAYHTGGGTSRNVKAKRLFYALRSRIQYAFKHFGRPGAWATCVAILCVEPLVRLLGALVRRRGGGDTLRAFLMLYRDLPNVVPGSFPHG